VEVKRQPAALGGKGPRTSRADPARSACDEHALVAKPRVHGRRLRVQGPGGEAGGRNEGVMAPTEGFSEQMAVRILL
jgi:hypothetical protein